MEFVRLTSADGVYLPAWFTPGSRGTVIHVHGMSGTGYDNRFLDAMRRWYTGRDIGFLTFNNRGSGLMTEGPASPGAARGGSCYELFAESRHDIAAAVDWATDQGPAVVLQGHSLGCAKAVHYLGTEPDPVVVAGVLLAPTDMVGWAANDTRHLSLLAAARDLVAQGKPQALVADDCWPNQTPLAAATYLSLCEPGTAVDSYGAGGQVAPLSLVPVPLQVVYGTDDLGIREIDGTIQAWQARVGPALPEGTQVNTVDGADHSFAGFEDTLATLTGTFTERHLALLTSHDGV